MDLQINDSYHPCGALYLRHYYLGKKLHREDGPANEIFYQNGTLETREYYRFRAGKPRNLFRG